MSRRRLLRRLTVDDAAAAEFTFEMLMGNGVGPRKEFGIGRHRLDGERIDAWWASGRDAQSVTGILHLLTIRR